MALAHVRSVDGNFTSGTSHTFAVDATATNAILHVQAFKNANTDTITGVTFNGTAMTQVQKETPGAGRYQYVYELVAPAQGSYNVVISSSSSTAIGGNATVHSGAAQSGQPDASRTAATTDTPTTQTITTVADNCWGLLFTTGGRIHSASTGSALRVSNTTYTDSSIFDSNAAKTPAGNLDMTTTYASTAATEGYIQVSIKPYVAASSAIKTWEGLADASVKTVNGLARASVKTRNGLA
jgi:hypothetical protein